MELIEMVDATILAFFTKVSHKFQRLTGRTNFFLAKTALCLAGLDILANIGNYWLHFLARETNIVQLVLGITVITFLFKDMYLCDRDEDNAIDSSNRATTFHYLYKSQVVRLMFVFTAFWLLPLGVGELLTGKAAFTFRLLSFLYMYAITAFFYFIAVDPLPPGKSKIREWAESFVAGFRRLSLVRPEASR